MALLFAESSGADPPGRFEGGGVSGPTGPAISIRGLNFSFDEGAETTLSAVVTVERPVVLAGLVCGAGERADGRLSQFAGGGFSPARLRFGIQAWKSHSRTPKSAGCDLLLNRVGQIQGHGPAHAAGVNGRDSATCLPVQPLNFIRDAKALVSSMGCKSSRRQFSMVVVPESRTAQVPSWK